MFYPKTFEFLLSQIKVESILDIGSTSTSKQHFDLIRCNDFQESFLNQIKSSTPNYVVISYRNFAPSYWIQKFDQLGYRLDPTLTRQTRLISYMEINSPDNLFAVNGLVFCKREREAFSSEQDAIITWAAGEDFCKKASVKVFVESLNRTTYRGYKFVFTHDMDMESREYFERSGFRIFDVSPSQCEWILRDRYKVYHDFLKRRKFKTVFLLDAKDIVFQTNPSEAFEETDRKLHFVAEGKLHSECDWNTKDQHNLQSDIANKTKNYLVDFRDWEVLCGGTIVGCSKAIKELTMLVWLGTLFTNASTDQAMLNYVYRHFYQNDSRCMIVDPRIHDLVATADLPKNPEPVVDSDFVIKHRETSEPYCLWHQWDRTKYHDSIIKKYL